MQNSLRQFNDRLDVSRMRLNYDLKDFMSDEGLLDIRYFDSQSTTSAESGCSAHYIILLLLEGSVEFNVNGEEFELSAGMVCFLPKNVTYTIKSVGHNTNVYGLKFKEEFISAFLRDDQFLRSLPYFFEQGRRAVKLTKERLLQIDSFFKDIKTEYAPDDMVKRGISQGLVYVMLQRLRIIFKEEFNALIASEPGFISKFRILIDEYFLERKSISQYAEMLKITPHHLIKKVKKLSGHTPAYFIRERVIREAQDLLINSDKNVSEIAYHLNFEDTSNFTKFFKRYAGHTPKTYKSMFD
ncbi:MAG: AraC family transcriptional regulator [Bacteroidota bacterium]